MGTKEVERRNTHEAMTEGLYFEAARSVKSSSFVIAGAVSEQPL